MGDEMYPGGWQEVANATNDSTWARLNAAMCNTTTGIAQSRAGGGFAVFSNPVGDALHLQTPAATVHFSCGITDLLGRTVMTGEDHLAIDVSGLVSGAYFIRIMDERGRERRCGF